MSSRMTDYLAKAEECERCALILPHSMVRTEYLELAKRFRDRAKDAATNEETAAPVPGESQK